MRGLRSRACRVERPADLTRDRLEIRLMGYSDSASFTMGDLTIHNMQHDRLGRKEDEPSGLRGMFAALLSPDDVIPPCITACPSGDLYDEATTVAADICYADSACIADGDTSPSRACFMCESDKAQKELTGPIAGPGEAHCYFNDVCVPKNAGKRWYILGNSNRCPPRADPPRRPFSHRLTHPCLRVTTACASNATPT